MNFIEYQNFEEYNFFNVFSQTRIPETIMHFKVKGKTMVICGTENIYVYDILLSGSSLRPRMTIDVTFAPAKVDFDEKFIFIG